MLIGTHSDGVYLLHYSSTSRLIEREREMERTMPYERYVVFRGLSVTYQYEYYVMFILSCRLED